MMMPFASAASRAMTTGSPLLFGPSPEMSMTRRSAVIRIFLEQRHREIDRAGDRGARGATDRRLQDLGGDGIGGFRTVDHAPGNDDLLVARRRPFEIGHRDLAVRPALAAPAGIPWRRSPAHSPRAGSPVRPCPSSRRRRRPGPVRHRPTRVVLARRSAAICLGSRRRCGNPRDITARQHPGDEHRSNRDTPAHSGPPVVMRIVTCKSGRKAGRCACRSHSS